MIDPALLKSYQNTRFIVCTTHGDLVLVIGERNRALDDLMETSDFQSGAFVTAWNPGSLKLSDEENRKRQAELIIAVQKRGYLFLEGWGVGQDEEWPPEASIFIIGIPEEAALELGKFFGQLAIVFTERGRPLELLLCPK
jgi:hypothetical protein